MYNTKQLEFVECMEQNLYIQYNTIQFVECI